MEIFNKSLVYKTSQIIQNQYVYFMVVNEVQIDPMYDPLYKVHSSEITKYSLIMPVICSATTWVSTLFKAFILGMTEPGKTATDSSTQYTLGINQ